MIVVKKSGLIFDFSFPSSSTKHRHRWTSKCHFDGNDDEINRKKLEMIKHSNLIDITKQNKTITNRL